MKKTIGIIGGMGPLATCDLMLKVIKNTDAKCDQEHVHLLIDNNTAIPDRTEAIIRGGASPLGELISSANRLAAAGADALVMACHSAHYLLPDLEQAVSIPFISLIDTTTKRLQKENNKTVALFATEGLSKAGIYQAEFEKAGINVLVPDDNEQKLITEVIYEVIKAGNPLPQPERFQALLDSYRDRGAERIVLGCTELPVAASKYKFAAKFIDPTYELALEIIRFGGAKLLADSE